MLLHGIDDTILIPHLYYCGVYPDEAKKFKLYKEINIYFEVGTKPKRN